MPLKLKHKVFEEYLWSSSPETEHLDKKLKRVSRHGNKLRILQKGESKSYNGSF